MGAITNTNFTDYKSIQDTIALIKKIGKSKGMSDSEIQGLVQPLEDALNNLMYNAVSLAETIVKQVIDVAKEIDKIITTNKSGLDLSSALKEFSDLQNLLTDGTTVAFDEIFTYE